VRCKVEIKNIDPPQCLDDPAICIDALGAISVDRAEAMFEAAQFADLLTDLGNPKGTIPMTKPDSECRLWIDRPAPLKS